MKKIFVAVMAAMAAYCRKPRLGMALIKLGGGVADIRGSIGGTVFSRNRYGAIARNRTIPVDPGTANQMTVRALMGQVRASYFDTLTAVQRAAWDVYAANVAMTNRLGETMYLTGYNMFCRTNIALLNAGLALIADAPTDFSLAGQDGSVVATVTAAANELSLAFDNTMDWANEDDGAMLVFESKPQNAGINYFKGPWNFLGKIDGDAVTAPTDPQTFTSQHSLAVGQKMFYQLRIARADGRVSEPFRVFDTVG